MCVLSVDSCVLWALSPCVCLCPLRACWSRIKVCISPRRCARVCRWIWAGASEAGLGTRFLLNALPRSKRLGEQRGRRWRAGKGLPSVRSSSQAGVRSPFTGSFLARKGTQPGGGGDWQLEPSSWALVTYFCVRAFLASEKRLPVHACFAQIKAEGCWLDQALQLLSTSGWLLLVFLGEAKGPHSRNTARKPPCHLGFFPLHSRQLIY